jgi:hypothetical protein
MDNLQQPLQPGTVLHFRSLEFVSPDVSYAMVLLPPPPRSTTTTTVVGSPGGGELDDISPWQKRNTRVCPATLLTGGGGDGATMARQEAAPHRLSDQSELTTPAPCGGHVGCYPRTWDNDRCRFPATCQPHAD